MKGERTLDPIHIQSCTNTSLHWCTVHVMFHASLNAKAKCNLHFCTFRFISLCFVFASVFFCFTIFFFIFLIFLFFSLHFSFLFWYHFPACQSFVLPYHVYVVHSILLYYCIRLHCHPVTVWLFILLVWQHILWMQCLCLMCESTAYGA